MDCKPSTHSYIQHTIIAAAVIHKVVHLKRIFFHLHFLYSNIGYVISCNRHNYFYALCSFIVK